MTEYTVEREITIKPNSLNEEVKFKAICTCIDRGELVVREQDLKQFCDASWTASLELVDEAGKKQEGRMQ